MVMASKQSCLFVLSAAIEGVSAQSFIQAVTLTHSSFNVTLATPEGKVVEFVQQDEASRRWLNEFKAKTFSIPISLKSVDSSRYSAIVIPHAPGAVNDLAHNNDLASILEHFLEKQKAICAIGMGVSALACVKLNDRWGFKGYSLTAASVFELSKTTYFGSLHLIPEDFIKDNGAKYSCTSEGKVHIVVDRHVVTGQNEASTLIAVQNLILLCTQRQVQGKSINR